MSNQPRADDVKADACHNTARCMTAFAGHLSHSHHTSSERVPRRRNVAMAFARFRDSLKSKFNELTGGNDGGNQALVNQCEDCCSEGLIQTDWSQVGVLCEMINSGDVGCAVGRNVPVFALAALLFKHLFASCLMHAVIQSRHRFASDVRAVQPLLPVSRLIIVSANCC